MSLSAKVASNLQTPIHVLHNSSHTSEHTQRCSQTRTNWTLFRDSCLESQNSGWPHCCRDEWFVWNKKHLEKSFSDRSEVLWDEKHWAEPPLNTERVFMVDFLPLPPWQQVTSCSSAPSSVHSEVSVSKQWRTIAGKGSRRRGGRHFSARFRLPNADLYLSSLQTQRRFRDSRPDRLLLVWPRSRRV